MGDISSDVKWVLWAVIVFAKPYEVCVIVMFMLIKIYVTLSQNLRNTDKCHVVSPPKGATRFFLASQLLYYLLCFCSLLSFLKKC